MKTLHYYIFSLIVSLFIFSGFEVAYATKGSNQNLPDGLPRILSVTPSHKLLYKGGNQEYYLMITLNGPDIKKESTKLPLNLAIVIDRSGSMAEKNKLDFVKKAAKTFISQLGPQDRVSIVDYDDTITLLAEPTLIGENLNFLLQKIDSLTPRGSTNLAGGMLEGGSQVERYFRDNAINRVLLLSDGLANVGVSNRSEVQDVASGLGRKGIQVSTFGVGSDFDEDMMTGIADASAGNYYFIENPTQVAGIFEKERNALTNVVAKNSHLEITIDAHLDIIEVYGYTYKTQGSKLVIDLPDLYSGQKRKILVKLIPHIQETIHQSTVAHVVYKFNDTRSDSKASEEDETVNSDVTNDLKAYGASIQTTVQSEVLKTQAGQTLDHAMKDYATGNVEEAKDELKKVRNNLQRAYELAPSPALKGQIDDADEAFGGVSTNSPGSEAGKVIIKQKKSDARDAMME